MGARELLGELMAAGFTVKADGDRLVIRPGSRLSDDMLAALAAAKPELLALLDVRARLLRWGWSEAEAERVAGRIACRGADDDRRTCIECSNYRPATHACAVHARAGLMGSDVSRDLAEVPQRCPGFRARGDDA
jgi:hypothetical protein